MSDNKTALAFAVSSWLADPATVSGLDETQRAALSNAGRLISTAFQVDPSDETQNKLYGGVGLQSVFDVFLKTQSRMKGSSPAPAAAAAAPKPAAAATSSSASASASSSAPSDADKESAERLKEEGNKAMKVKDYGAAIAAYGEAIDLHPTNPVYYSNRAAAFSQVGQHERAAEDAREAAKVDPKFGKAYSRLGHALFASGKYDEAVEAYQQGLEVDPTNDLMQRGLKSAKEQATKSAAGPSSSAGPSASRDVDAGAPGPSLGQPGGGMPDLSSILQNPMMMQMAQNMMANGGLEGLMNNPMIRNMMSSMQSSGGMPDMSQIQQLMQDPAMREMAQSFMGGAGGQGGAGRGAGSSPDNNMYG